MSTQLEGGFRLHFFQGDVEAGKTQNISASSLDSNFQLVKPRKIDGGLKHYTINQETNGWDLRIFPAWPSVASILTFGVRTLNDPNAGNPQLSWTPIEEVKGASPESPITAPGSVLASAISPGPDGSLLTTISATAQWSEAPPSGTPGWRQVERCDGQTMYVWGTEWAAPA